MILVVSHPDDVHARAVLAEIAVAGGEARILDTADFPHAAQVTIAIEEEDPPDVAMRWPADERTLDFADVGAVWWRRPQPHGLDPALVDEGYRSFALGECMEAVGGLWQLLDATWINPPLWDDRAHRKPLQLKVARACGLDVPATCMTNDPVAARAFVDRLGPGRVIYKAFAGTERDWRETRMMDDARAADLGAVRFAPMILQAFVACRYDVRLTIVGDEMHAAAIHSQETGYPLDFRMDVLSTRMTPVDVPARVRAGLLRLMRELRLVYGAVDFRVTPDGDWVFLEINPAGQWLFVEDATGQPIARALARHLVEADRRPKDGTARTRDRRSAASSGLAADGHRRVHAPTSHADAQA